MKIDFYTKMMLTLIAAGVLYLCFLNGAVPAHANSAENALPQRVVIVGTETQRPLPVSVYMLNKDGTSQWVGAENPLPVRSR